MAKTAPIILPELTLAYMAGFFDGEGTFTICCTKARGMTEFYGLVNASQKTRPIIDWLRENIGFGQVVYRAGSKGSVGGPETGAYVWEAKYQQSLVIAEALLPYLRVKRRQAEIVIEIGRIKEARRGARVGFGPMKRTPPDVMHRYAHLCRDVQLLNRGNKISGNLLALGILDTPAPPDSSADDADLSAGPKRIKNPNPMWTAALSCAACNAEITRRTRFTATELAGRGFYCDACRASGQNLVHSKARSARRLRTKATQAGV